MTTRDDLVAKLSAIGVVAVVFEFDGSGDSGELNDVSVLRHADFPVPYQADIDDDPDLYELQEKSHTLDEPYDLDDLCYAALEYFDGDWVNNEGGYGRGLIDLRTGSMYINGWQRASRSADSHADHFITPRPAPTTLEGVMCQTLGLEEPHDS